MSSSQVRVLHYHLPEIQGKPEWEIFENTAPLPGTKAVFKDPG